MLTDIEISRALNALSTTMRDQRHERFDPARVEEIVCGALAGEQKLRATATGERSGEVRSRQDGRLVAQLHLGDGGWEVQRKLRAGESSWALPQPAHAESEGAQRRQGERDGAC